VRNRHELVRLVTGTDGQGVAVVGPRSLYASGYGYVAEVRGVNVRTACRRRLLCVTDVGQQCPSNQSSACPHGPMQRPASGCTGEARAKRTRLASLSENNYFAVATTPRRWVLATLLRSLPELAASLESAPHMPLSFIASEFVLRALQLSSMPATLSGYVPKFP